MYILQKYIIPKILRNLLLDIWTGGKVASRARARYANFPPKNLSTRHYWCYLFVCEAFE